MLVLTRKRSEMIRIGDDIVIKVIKTGNGAVKLGIEAPQNVRVLRAELCHEHGEPMPSTFEALGGYRAVMGKARAERRERAEQSARPDATPQGESNV